MASKWLNYTWILSWLFAGFRPNFCLKKVKTKKTKTKQEQMSIEVFLYPFRTKAYPVSYHIYYIKNRKAANIHTGDAFISDNTAYLIKHYLNNGIMAKICHVYMSADEWTNCFSSMLFIGLMLMLSYALFIGLYIIKHSSSSALCMWAFWSCCTLWLNK